MTDKERFISKWSSWWSLTRDAHELNKAFESELTALSLPAPSQDGTAEEVLMSKVKITKPKQWAYWHPVLEAMTTYAASLRAEIERLNVDVELANTGKSEYFRMFQEQLHRTEKLIAELTAANQRIKELEDTIL